MQASGTTRDRRILALWRGIPAIAVTIVGALVHTKRRALAFFDELCLPTGTLAAHYHALRRESEEGAKALVAKGLPADAPPLIDVTISGGGFRIGYALGVLYALNAVAAIQSRWRIDRAAGSSSGASLALLTHTHRWEENVVGALAYVAVTRRYLLVLPGILWNRLLHKMVPRDTPLPTPGKVTFVHTAFSCCQVHSRRVSSFSSTADLIKASIASAAMPFVTCPWALPMMWYHGELVLDGGITELCPDIGHEAAKPLLFIRYHGLPAMYQKLRIVLFPSQRCLIALVRLGITDGLRLAAGESVPGLNVRAAPPSP
eukprot:NODE_14547_length_1102_cov_4.537436.p1 GENE.NODE_14547_length_1102_cov_4.537436~~NODE_14547_length_1102_cov_4.537436.p1  ORF type:complete len:316 (-),score=58.18 NODE_14547_length_1102_cov_4.537436:76-1023(-)